VRRKNTKKNTKKEEQVWENLKVWLTVRFIPM
jgi:hypothetical protein